MSIKKNDEDSALIAELSKLLKKHTRNSPLKSISNLFSKKKRREINNLLFQEVGYLSSEEKTLIIKAMELESVFKIVMEMDKPENNVDKELESKAELRLKEIEKKDEDTHFQIFGMKTSHMFGVSRMNRLNKLLSDNSAEDIINIHNLHRSKYPNKIGFVEGQYQALMTAFNFQPTEQDEIEYIAYLVWRLLSSESVEISATQFKIWSELENKYGKEVRDDYNNFLDYLCNNFKSDHKIFLKMIHNKYSTSPEETLNKINEAMKNKSNIVRHKFFEMS